MREFKLRARDKRSKELIQIQGFKFVGEKRIQLFYLDTDGCSTTCTCEKEFIVLMQYTGLKDKNGNEIYEGDIVSSIDGTFSNTGLGIVQAYKGMYVSFYGQDAIGRDQFDELHTVCNSREIIGNIYENPELLEWRE